MSNESTTTAAPQENKKLEAKINDSKMISAGDIAAIAKLSPAIGLIYGEKQGTAFLIANDWIMTNNHVLPTPAACVQATVAFNFEKHTTNLQSAMLDSSMFYTNATLDYTVVKITKQMDAYIPLTRSACLLVIHKGENAHIIGHPNGFDKRISSLENSITKVGPNFIEYTTNTEYGSSGSPVFNAQWQLIALHHSAGTEDPHKPNQFLTNEGVRISSIITDLEQKKPEIAKILIRNDETVVEPTATTTTTTTAALNTTQVPVHANQSSLPQQAVRDKFLAMKISNHAAGNLQCDLCEMLETDSNGQRAAKAIASKIEQDFKSSIMYKQKEPETIIDKMSGYNISIKWLLEVFSSDPRLNNYKDLVDTWLAKQK